MLVDHLLLARMQLLLNWGMHRSPWAIQGGQETGPQPCTILECLIAENEREMRTMEAPAGAPALALLVRGFQFEDCTFFQFTYWWTAEAPEQQPSATTASRCSNSAVTLPRFSSKCCSQECPPRWWLFEFSEPVSDTRNAVHCRKDSIAQNLQFVLETFSRKLLSTGTRCIVLDWVMRSLQWEWLSRQVLGSAARLQCWHDHTTHVIFDTALP